MFIFRISPSPGFRRVGAGFCLAAVSALALASCSSSPEPKKYRMPTALCGIAVSPDLVEPLLPGGAELSQKASTPNGGTERCDLLVDGKSVLSTRLAWWRPSSITQIADAYSGTDGGEVSKGGRFQHTGTAAAGRACTVDEQRRDNELFIVVQVYASGIDNKDAMKKLITAFTGAVERSDYCT